MGSLLLPANHHVPHSLNPEDATAEASRGSRPFTGLPRSPENQDDPLSFCPLFILSIPVVADPMPARLFGPIIRFGPVITRRLYVDDYRRNQSRRLRAAPSGHMSGPENMNCSYRPGMLSNRPSTLSIFARLQIVINATNPDI